MRSSSLHLKRSPVLPNAASRHERCRGELTGAPRKDHCAPANPKMLKENHITVFYREQRTTGSPTRRECVHCTCSGGHLRESSILSNPESTRLSPEGKGHCLLNIQLRAIWSVLDQNTTWSQLSRRLRPLPGPRLTGRVTSAAGKEPVRRPSDRFHCSALRTCHPTETKIQ